MSIAKGLNEVYRSELLIDQARYPEEAGPPVRFGKVEKRTVPGTDSEGPVHTYTPREVVNAKVRKLVPVPNQCRSRSSLLIRPESDKIRRTVVYQDSIPQQLEATQVRKAEANSGSTINALAVILYLISPLHPVQYSGNSLFFVISPLHCFFLGQTAQKIYTACLACGEIRQKSDLAQW